MRSKDEILKDLGLTEYYNPHADPPPDTKDVMLIEVLIDIRDILNDYLPAIDGHLLHHSQDS